MSPRRPPKKWFYETLKEVESRDPKAIVGHIWYHKLSEKKRRQIIKRESKGKKT